MKKRLVETEKRSIFEAVRSLPEKDIFIGSDISIDSGWGRIKSMINDKYFRAKYGIIVQRVYRGGAEKSIPLKDTPITLNVMRKSYSAYYEDDTRFESEKFNLAFVPRLQMYSDNSLETLDGFVNTIYDPREKKEFEAYYSCNLWTPRGDSSLGVEYIHPVKDKELLSGLLDLAKRASKG